LIPQEVRFPPERLAASSSCGDSAQVQQIETIYRRTFRGRKGGGGAFAASPTIGPLPKSVPAAMITTHHVLRKRSTWA
jgi:hypothetical protein